ncbi:hypothetical protein F5Y15DRAFT_412836 [Xylariaceae sp. FL0016]|nr:hypothetical protein F5Y15DRAFT_412836 [Xylariaceae sp. FL0016]
MDKPTTQIAGVIGALTEGTPAEQQRALEENFLPSAYFIHPFCRVPSFDEKQVPFTPWKLDSRWLMLMVYKWYRILSPDIKLVIDSIAFDSQQRYLYVTMRQTFTLWFVPFSLWQANVRLVTVLELEQHPYDENGCPRLDQGRDDNHAISPKKRFYIKGQEDHYQIEDFVKFVAPFGASVLWVLWQLFATLVCVVGTFVGAPLMRVRGQVLGQRKFLKSA